MGRGMTYRTVVADPPWPYSTPGGGPLHAAPGHRPNSWKSPVGSVRRYGAMTLKTIREIRPPAESDAHLYLWTTNGFLGPAHDVVRAWGFSPKTCLTWIKTKPDGSVSMKTGYYFRGATEHVLFAVRGSLKLQTDEALPTGYMWPRQPHSVKPDAFYDLVEKASPGPYLELFARRARFGWDYWGDESLGTAEFVEEPVPVADEGGETP